MGHHGLSKSLLAIFMALLISNIPQLASAAAAQEMVSTNALVEELTRAQAQDKIRVQLERDDVRSELVKLGVSPDEISKRVASLSDSEMRQLAQQLDQAQFGGDVTGILVVVVLVLLIIYLAKRI